MKKTIQLTILLAAFMSMVSTKVFAQIIVENDNGVKITYSYLYEGLELEVIAANPIYSGKIIIPEEVSYEGQTYKVTGIGESAFSGCTNLTSVVLPNSIKSIKNSAFRGCTNLKSVNIPDGVKAIENSTFFKCSSLTSVTISQNVTYIGNDAFSGCTSLTSVTIGHGVKTIGDAAFSGCSNINSLTIPNSVTNIGDGAFSSCYGLKSINIPNSVTTIGESAFYNCYGLSSITIPNSVTSIGEGSFYRCLNLTSVNIGNSVTKIEPGTFESCSRLTSVTIGNSVKEIGENAFSKCTSLATITIPNSVTSIGGWAFEGCESLTMIIFGKSVNYIGRYAFRNDNNIESIISLNETPSFFYGKRYMEGGSVVGVFNDMIFDSATLYVPEGTIDKYKATEGWKDFRYIEEGIGPDVDKCATPKIYYKKGNLSFESETEDVDFVTNITDSDINSFYDSSIDLTVTYHISVYATKPGAIDSEVAEATLCWIEVDPQKEGITEETPTEAKQLQALPVLIQAEGGEISIDGAPEGTKVAVYDAGGVEVGTAISHGGKTLVPAHLPQGSIAIVKIGEKAVKVAVK